MSKYKPLFSPGDFRKVITLGQLEELTGIKRTTLRVWLRDGKIPGAFHTEKGRRWQFRRDSLEQWWRDMHSENEKPS